MSGSPTVGFRFRFKRVRTQQHVPQVDVTILVGFVKFAEIRSHLLADYGIVNDGHSHRTWMWDYHSDITQVGIGNFWNLSVYA